MNVSRGTKFVGNSENIFALRVKGTSMIEDLIDDGDIILLKPAKTAEKGQKVAVWLKDEEATTLKPITLKATASTKSRITSITIKTLIMFAVLKRRKTVQKGV